MVNKKSYRKQREEKRFIHELNVKVAHGCSYLFAQTFVEIGGDPFIREYPKRTRKRKFSKDYIAKKMEELDYDE